MGDGGWTITFSYITKVRHLYSVIKSFAGKVALLNTNAEVEVWLHIAGLPPRGRASHLVANVHKH